MSIAANTVKKINQLPQGFVFTYKDVLTDPGKSEAVIKSLNRMVAKGKLEKLARGRFYRPEISVFGKLGPNMDEVLKDFLIRDGKRIGYYTGVGIYNQLGLTTQMSVTIEIGCRDYRPRTKRSYYRIKFLKQPNEITEESIPLLQLLDAIREINKIPDAYPKFVIKRMRSIVKDLNLAEKERMVALALQYAPRTRAILGAILDSIENGNLTEPLLKSLNPATTYNVYDAHKALNNCDKWKIV